VYLEETFLFGEQKMYMQDYSAITDMLAAGGMIFLGVFFVVIILLIILGLKIWKWSIEKFGGSVESLGQVFVTLILGTIASAIVNFILNIFLSAILLTALSSLPTDAAVTVLIVSGICFLIASIIIFPLVVSKRHNMGWGSALIAWIVADIIMILIFIAFVVALLFIFFGGLAILGL